MRKLKTYSTWVDDMLTNVKAYSRKEALTLFNQNAKKQIKLSDITIIKF